MARSTPLSRSQAGTKDTSTKSGMPELKPKKMQVSIFLVNRISVQWRRSAAAGFSVVPPVAVMGGSYQRLVFPSWPEPP